MLCKWMKSEKGAVLPLMGVAIFTLLMAVGLTIDYARALIVKERLQWALDAAALAGVKKAKQGNAAVQAEAQKYFDANFPTGYMSTSKGTVIATPKTSEDSNGISYRFTVSSMSMDTYIMTTVGVDNLGVGAAAEVNTLPVTPLDVVFSIDLSGSMQVMSGKGCKYLPYGANCYGTPSKLDAAKGAMLQLVDQLDSGTVDTRFGIVPWSSYVNPLGAIAGTFTTHNCFDGKKQVYLADENPVKTWTGNAATPPMFDASTCREFSAGTIKNVGSMRPMLYLTSSVSAVKSAINDLKAEANTDGALGTYWAYAMLQLKDKGWLNWRDAAINKSIVLLTDGNNTKYYKTPGIASATDYGEPSNTRQKEVCKLARDAKVTVYTIAYDMDSAEKTAKQMLSDCASKACPTQKDDKCFFDANNDAELYKAMATIGQTMMTMRLTR